MVHGLAEPTNFIAQSLAELISRHRTLLNNLSHGLTEPINTTAQSLAELS